MLVSKVNTNGSCSPREVLEQIAALWSTNRTAVNWRNEGSAEHAKFIWQPADFVLQASANRHPSGSDHGTRVRIDTNFISGVDTCNPDLIETIASVAHFYSSTFAWVSLPEDLRETFVDKGTGDFDFTRMWMTSTAYIREDTAGWLPAFMARMAILQPISAEINVGAVTHVLHARADASINESNATESLRDLLEDVFIREGQGPSKWIGTDEFDRFIDTWGRSDHCFGFGDPKGLSLETPFGHNSALIRLLTDQPHPLLGNGLLVTLQLPFRDSALAISKLCIEMNYMEASMWTGFPLLGSWHACEVGESSAAAFSMFVPNALYEPLIATNVAIWMLHRARWVRTTFFENLVDLTMSEILKGRIGLEL